MFMRSLLLLVVLGTFLVSCGSAFAADTEMRGIWMHATQIKTRAEADEWIAKIDQANLNAVFILVWYWGGQAAYSSELCPMLEGVEEGYDPLGYMIQECHKRDIEVHAWYVNGAYGAAKPKHVLDEHPEWAVDTGGDGKLWYDFGKPELRKFQSDLMIECLKNYDVDGIHFDYIRYGPKICYCKHCQEEFARRYGHEPLTSGRRESFPIVSTVSANPVDGPTTAKVLAEFSNGIPAIAVNELGKGKALLLNWHAENQMPPAVSETLRRALSEWGAAKDKVFVMDTAPNRERYGKGSTSAAVQLLQRLGYQAKAIKEDGLAGLPEGSTLVLCALYIIPDDIAEQIEQFVQAGGILVVIDGPVFSMTNESIQRVLGMSKTAGYFNEMVVIQATGQSDLVPSSDREIDLEKEKLRGENWAEFRKWGVTELVRDVYNRAKALKPQAQVTAAVFTPLAGAHSVFQDWPNWLQEDIIDYVIPMAYTMSNDSLAEQIEEWQGLDATLERIIPGLSIYARGEGGSTTRDIALVLSQHELCMDSGARGNLYFSLHYLNEPLTNAFRNGPYQTKIRAYRPPQRNVR